MTSESNVQKQIWLGLAENCTLFRLNTGKAWISGLGPKGIHRLKNGSVEVQAPRPIAIGLGLMSGNPVVGAGDLIGWTKVVVTQDMVGATLAVLTSVEVKESKGGRISPEQLNWKDQIVASGGIAIVANSAQEAVSCVQNWYKKLC